MRNTPVVIQKKFNQELADVLKRGGVAVVPTDTIYGIVGSALNKKNCCANLPCAEAESKKAFYSINKRTVRSNV